MRISRIALTASILILAGCLFSQTRVPPDQIRPQLSTGVFVNITGKGVILATVDPATLILDTTGVTPVLRALSQLTTVNEKHVSILPVVGATTVTIPDASYNPASLNVFVNGILQSLTNDYSVTGTTITLLRAATTGDIVQLTYRF